MLKQLTFDDARVIANSVLIGTSTQLHVFRTGIKSGMSSNWGQVRISVRNYSPLRRKISLLITRIGIKSRPSSKSGSIENLEEGICP